MHLKIPLIKIRFNKLSGHAFYDEQKKHEHELHTTLSVTRLGDLLDFGPLFKDFANN